MLYRWFVLWAVLAPLTARADNPPVAPAGVDARFAALQMQIGILNERLGKLEQRLQSRLPAPAPDATASMTAKPVDNPEDTPPSAAAPAQARSGLTAHQEREELRASWRQLQYDLSPDAVRQLLGEPHSEFALGQQTLWYYRYPGIGGGSVMLDSKKKVAGWQEPPFRGW